MSLNEINAEIALMDSLPGGFWFDEYHNLCWGDERNAYHAWIVDRYDLSCILNWKDSYSEDVWNEYYNYGKEVHDNGTYVNCWGFVNHMAKEAVRRFCVKHPEYMYPVGMSFIRSVARI